MGTEWVVCTRLGELAGISKVKIFQLEVKPTTSAKQPNEQMKKILLPAEPEEERIWTND